MALIGLVLTAFSIKKMQPSSAPENISVNGKLFTALFQQKAAEYDALCFQAYNLAKLRIDSVLQRKHAKPYAIVTDLDETVLNNSAFAVHQGLTGKEYETEAWHKWAELGKADTTAGSFRFFNYAASKGIAIYYITNRDEADKAGTIKNLKHFGFPTVDDAHLLLKDKESSKEKRRAAVAATHEIVLFLGDNLADFCADFDNHKSTEEREKATVKNADLFGTKFVMVPNPNYGDWESALYNYKYNYTAAQKDSIILHSLKNY